MGFSILTWLEGEGLQPVAFDRVSVAIDQLDRALPGTKPSALKNANPGHLHKTVGPYLQSRPRKELPRLELAIVLCPE